jgi:hypothetical protein
LKITQQLYDGERMDCDVLQRLVEEEAVTHVLVTAGNPAIACGFARKVFDDPQATIFSLGQTKLTSAGAQ